MDSTWDEGTPIADPDIASQHSSAARKDAADGTPGEVFVLADDSLSSATSIGTPDSMTFVLGDGRTVNIHFDRDSGELKVAADGGRLACLSDDGIWGGGVALTVIP